jgi:formylglycine-generating enzyme required for sulfatase activity
MVCWTTTVFAEAKIPKILESNTGMSMVKVEQGCYQMGDENGDDDEQPVHKVCLDGFWLGQYEVTNRQYVTFLNQSKAKETESWFEPKQKDDDSHIYGKVGAWQVDKGYENYPVVEISRMGALAYTQWLSQKTGEKFDLPSEAQWEYACRNGGQQGVRYAIGHVKHINQLAWYKKNSGKKFHPVGKKRPNVLGLYDMNGNVWEWVSDAYTEDGYSRHEERNPVSKELNESFVFRGGSWGDTEDLIRCSVRSNDAPTDANKYLGFRVLKMMK